MPTAKGTRNTERFMRIGERRNTKKIEGNMRWTHIIDTTRNGVVSVISAIVWFGIIILISAIMFVLYAVVSYDERKKKQEKERNKE